MSQLSEKHQTDFRAAGWTYHGRSLGTESYDELWAKKGPLKSGELVQVCVEVYYATTLNGRRLPLTAQLELCGEKPDGAWIVLKVYALDKFEVAEFDRQATQLFACYETLCNSKN
jgi:hypothetical protein